MFYSGSQHTFSRAMPYPPRVRELAPVLLEGFDLAVHELGHVLPVIRLVGAPEEDVAHRVRFEALRDLLRVLVTPARERVHGVERGLADCAMVGVIDASHGTYVD